MKEHKKMKIIDNSGKVMEYVIILAFLWTKTNKNYIIYTDNTIDENNDLNIYASIYDPNDSTKLDEIKTDEEWSEIEKRIQILLNDEGDIDEQRYN